jgi:NAD-dependent dihydropyrimidine dehydrogenase PreA subunit
MALRYLSNVSTLRLEVARCVGCRMCVTVCPQAVWAVTGKKATIVDLDACMECSACAMNCPEGAITVRRGVGCAASVVEQALGLGSGQTGCC